LDSDRIDAQVESLNAVNVEYAIPFEDSVILFGDKTQFRFRGGNILSPSSYEIRQELSYEVNTFVRPLFMNDRIFFAARRGDSNAIYELKISNNSNVDSYANDLTAHCQTYIDGEIDKLTGSAVNSMLFVSSMSPHRGESRAVVGKRNTVFMFKYYDSGNQRHQEAWSKWTFNGNLYSAFAINKHLYIMIDRDENLAATDWTVGDGFWHNDKGWKNLPFVFSPNSFASQDQFERINIFPISEDRIHLDGRRLEINFEGTPIEGYVSFGEWVYGTEGNRDFRGILLLRTLEMRSSGKVKVWVNDLQRASYREIPSEYAQRDKIMMYGNSKDVRVGIKNDGLVGFRVDVVSFEGTIKRRQDARSK
jgi:hypothetical protein